MTIARASVTFSIEDEEKNKKIYLGLLDTGSTGSLTNEEIMNKLGLETTKGSSTWDTNNGAYKLEGWAQQRFCAFTNSHTREKRTAPSFM